MSAKHWVLDIGLSEPHFVPIEFNDDNTVTFVTGMMLIATKCPGIFCGVINSVIPDGEENDKHVLTWLKEHPTWRNDYNIPDEFPLIKGDVKEILGGRESYSSSKGKYLMSTPKVQPTYEIKLLEIIPWSWSTTDLEFHYDLTGKRDRRYLVFYLPTSNSRQQLGAFKAEVDAREACSRHAEGRERLRAMTMLEESGGM